jgi:hypothetical protein
MQGKSSKKWNNEMTEYKVKLNIKVDDMNKWKKTEWKIGRKTQQKKKMFEKWKRENDREKQRSQEERKKEGRQRKRKKERK